VGREGKRLVTGGQGTGGHDNSAAVLLVDVIKDFEHEDGDRLFASFRARHPALREAVEKARRTGTPVAYANDSSGTSGSDASSFVQRALAGKAGDLVSAIPPDEDDLFVLKGRYSAFDETRLASLLKEEEIAQLFVAGTATERCVFQTAIDAVRLGFDVSVLARACRNGRRAP
jgi:nicotinamidase-related amidase